MGNSMLILGKTTESAYEIGGSGRPMTNKIDRKVQFYLYLQLKFNTFTIKI